MIKVVVEHVPGGDVRAGLAALIEATIAMHPDPVLDEAMGIAHDVLAAHAPGSARRRAIEATVVELREQLAAVEAQLKQAG
jgi:hypothetical protein